MGSKPKAQEYKPSATDQMQTKLAADQMRRYQRDYKPLITKERDMAAKERLAPTLKGIAQADTMQALTGQSSLSLSQGLGQSANIALGAVNQQLQANVSAVGASTKRQADILAAGKGLQFDAGDALAQASRQATSKGLAEASATQQVRMAKSAALGQFAGGVAAQGMFNYGQTNNPFKSRQFRYDKDEGLQTRDVAFGGLGTKGGWG